MLPLEWDGFKGAVLNPQKFQKKFDKRQKMWYSYNVSRKPRLEVPALGGASAVKLGGLLLTG